MDEVEEIKNRLNIADVISEYIQLTPAGTNFKARCPFHNEKTPSFFVSPEKQIWHCFGCDLGGDIFTFVQKMEGIEFRDALKILADKAGVRLAARNPQVESKKNRLLEICDWAARFYYAALLRSKQARVARDYLESRGVSSEAIQDFKLGYSPNAWDLVTKFLHKKGFSDQEIITAGIATQKRGKPYDRFRNRLMFPITNVHGQVVGFGARVLDPNEDHLGKYINSPQTPIYDKSSLLYGLDRAKTEIKKQNLCIAVEGYLDVIASHRAGIKNVIGVSGTALTPSQLSLLKRYTKNLALCFDADPAGFKAAEKGIGNAITAGMNVRVIVLPSGEDPDSLISKDPKLWLAAVKKSKVVMDFYFDFAFQTHNPQKVEGKKLIAAELLPVIKKIPDDIEQAHYLQELARKLKVEEEVLRRAMEKIGDSPRVPKSDFVAASEDQDTPLALEEILGRRILGIGLKFPEFLDQIFKEVNTSILSSQLQEIYKALKMYYNKNGGLVLADFKQKIKSSDQSLATKIDVAILDIEKDFEGEDLKEDIAEELGADLRRLKKVYLTRRLKTLSYEIAEAESQKEQARLKDLTAKFSSLTHNLREL